MKLNIELPINLQRGGGKTTSLVKRSHDTGIIIVCPTVMHKDNIMKIASDLELEIPSPVSMSELLKLRGLRSNDIYIDDLDTIVEQLLIEKFGTLKIRAATLSDNKLI